MAIQIRKYINSDRDKICQLFKEFSEYQRDREFWVWLNRVIGTDESIVTVAVDGDKIIGHYAIVPHDMLLNGISFKSGLSIHAFIHPKYRGKVLIYKISELAYEISKKRGIKMIYGFPNVNYRNIQIKIEGWKEVSLFKSIEISNEAISINNNKFILTRVTDSYADLFLLDEIIAEKESDKYIRIKKNINYYRNRYISHPQSLYECFFVYKEEEIKAFIVFKIFQNSKGHIIDYVKNDSVSEKDILNIAFNFFKNKVKSLILWPVNNKFKEELELLDNKKNNFETFLGIKYLDYKFEKESEDMIDFSKWELMMGDSDAF